MGRRKERRLAANSAAGRRVKLDLFAEPSGDTAGSSVQEEVGGDIDSKVVDKLPGSPSSSGWLWYWEQSDSYQTSSTPATVHYYLNFRPIMPSIFWRHQRKFEDHTGNNAPIGQRPQNPLLLLEQYSDEELDDASSDALAEDVSVDNDHHHHHHHQGKNAAGKNTEDIKSSAGNEPCNENSEQLLMDRTFASQDPLQKVENGVMSDYEDLLRETNNLEENTSPTAPDKKPVEDLSSGWKMVLHEESNQYYYWNITTGETSWEIPDVLALGSVTSAEKVGAVIVEGTSLDLEKDDVIARKQLNGDSKPNCETSDVAEEGTGMGGPDEQSKGDSFLSDPSMVNANEVDLEHSEENKTGNDLPPQLVRHCEILLERLNSLKSLSSHLEGQDIRLKNEIEVRLADITALAPHGSSLLPFWLHSEAQLKWIESTIDNVVKRHGSSPTNVINDSLKPCNGIGADTEINSTEKNASFVAVEFHSPECNAKKSNLRTQSDGHTENDFTETETETRLTPKPDLHSAQEVDMDVDMEVEDTSTSISGAQYQHVSSEQNIEPFLPPLPEDEHFPPPPPDDEPFPPPPPDDEPFPPLPSDDEPSYPPVSQPESVQLFPYSEHYTLSYPGSGFEYYGQIPTQVSGTTVYAHLPHYYENAYAVAPVVINPVGPNDYYGLQSGALNPAPLSVESAVEPGNQESDVAGSLQPHVKSGSNSLVMATPGVLGSSLGTGKAATEVPDAQPSSSSITAPAMGTVAETTSKVQPKASRSKKRAATTVSTLRPNKKVSSLVDKWKAVKEELHEEEEEDEPENAYEILEKKRQREIEEWRAQQIASGEAKDNANFQPLGGDWRERVKRRMAQKKKETRQSSPDVATGGKQQSDLVGLSRGLPSGWLAYWDDTSKQVYYGNTVTSETTWSKPTD